MRIGERIVRWRTSRGLTQRKAAKAAGLSQALWSKLEDGRMTRIGLDVARRIVEVSCGEIVLDHFDRPRGKKVHPVPGESSTSLAEDALHGRKAS